MKKLLLALFALLMFAAVPAIADTETDYIKSIIEVGYDYSKVGFESAVSYGDSRTVENFIKSGYNPNMKIAGVPVTFCAVINEKPATLDLLLANGADSNATVGKVTLLASAIKLKNTQLVNVLLKHKADVNKPSMGLTPLNLALLYKNIEMSKLLIKSGAVVDNASLRYAKRTKDTVFIEYIYNIYNKEMKLEK